MEDLSLIIGAMSSKGVHLELDKSAMAGLKKMPIDIFDDVYLGEVHNTSLNLCVDVRNFSDFLCSQDEDTVFQLIKEFTSNLLSCINQFAYGCSYYKLLGDGALIIWDETTEDTINEALTMFEAYTEFVNEELFKPHEKLGLAGALVVDEVYKYEMSAELSQLKYRDYVGYGINLACRLQNLANSDELIINEKLANMGVPFKVDTSKKIIRELRILKGLKKEDRKRVLFYDKS